MGAVRVRPAGCRRKRQAAPLLLVVGCGFRYLPACRRWQVQKSPLKLTACFVRSSPLQVKKPLLKLTDDDYNENSLQVRTRCRYCTERGKSSPVQLGWAWGGRGWGGRSPFAALVPPWALGCLDNDLWPKAPHLCVSALHLTCVDQFLPAPPTSPMQDLLAEQGPAYDISLRAFYDLQRTITGWPGRHAVPC